MAEQHRTPEHREARAAFAPIVAAGEALCAEPICLIERDGGTRWIDPEEEWDAAHDRRDPTGRTYLGPAHSRCNRSEGATWGNRRRRQQAAAEEARRVVVASRDW